MLLDQEQIFADRIAITTGTALMPHVKDLGPFSGTPPNTYRDIANGQKPPWLYINATATFVGGTSVAFEVISDDNPAMSTPLVHFTSGVIPTANLVIGSEIKLPFIRSLYQQYLGVRAVAVGTFTNGTVLVAMVDDVDKLRQYRGNSPNSA